MVTVFAVCGVAVVGNDCTAEGLASKNALLVKKIKATLGVSMVTEQVFTDWSQLIVLTWGVLCRRPSDSKLAPKV
ncbi:hypothetical protein SERLADRAFT_391182 [Serpula lacrymans var. lacrymans S7.9]|uniref:Uncharacterized protein n=1 Tax=Serpula lacrymans var. lacrymans (strain S7.9) TaxID=578457 RepID=F8NWU2_SERL9|nr:uncharacterized protein SERLADRAFT_391182 [Serpula lacrymans var. lacrymans S7.9]EGO25062.1 hypothetical protein SERLADRAFT_391182 [Serpula lacrymans var. lacrymans S7.9]